MKLIDFNESKKLLQKYDFKFPEEKEVKKFSEALNFLKKHKKISLKLYSKKISHKTDKGLVFKEITTEKNLKTSFNTLNKKKTSFKGRIIIQKWITGLNLILGGGLDRTFSKIIMLGSGGIYAELIKDVSFKIPPLKEKDINDLFNDLKITKFFNYRGQKHDTHALKNNIKKMSELILKEPNLKEIEINPLIINEKGVLVIDARIITL